jgi:hypothetical protein
MTSPVKITKDLRVIAPPDGPPLTGTQALELGKKLLQEGAIKVALEAIDYGHPIRSRSAKAEAN